MLLRAILTSENLVPFRQLVRECWEFGVWTGLWKVKWAGARSVIPVLWPGCESGWTQDCGRVARTDHGSRGKPSGAEGSAGCSDLLASLVVRFLGCRFTAILF